MLWVALKALSFPVRKQETRENGVAANCFIRLGGLEESPPEEVLMASPTLLSRQYPASISISFIIYSLIFHVHLILRSSRKASASQYS
jgi:hypothetical protein